MNRRQAPAAEAGWGGTAVLVLGLGAGASALVASAWAQLHPSAALPAPPWPAVGLGMLVAVAARCLSGLGRASGGREGELGLVGLVTGIALVVAFSGLRPGGAAATAAAGFCVFALWWQTGRIWSALIAAQPPAPVAGRTTEDLERAGPRVAQTADGPGVIQGLAGGLVLASGAIAVTARVLAHAPVPFGAALLAVAGAAVEAGCAALLCAQGLRRALVRRAAIEGARVAPGFLSRASAGALVVAALAVVLAAILPAYPAVLGWAGGGLRRGILALFAQGVPGGAGGGGNAADVALRGGSGGASAGSDFLALFADAVLLAVAVALVGAIIRVVRLALASPRHGARLALWPLFLELWAALLVALAGLFSVEGLRGMFAALRLRPGRRGALGRPQGPAGAQGSARPAAFRDPRRRVRAAYRRMLAEAGRRGRARAEGETPRRFGRRLRPTLPAAQGPVAEITALYEQARFSPHPVTPAQAAAADGASEAIGAALRQQAAPPP